VFLLFYRRLLWMEYPSPGKSRRPARCMDIHTLGQDTLVSGGYHSLVPSGYHSLVPGGYHSLVPGGYHSLVPGGYHSLVHGGQHTLVPHGQHTLVPHGQHTLVPHGQHTLVPHGQHTLVPGGYPPYPGNGDNIIRKNDNQPENIKEFYCIKKLKGKIKIKGIVPKLLFSFKIINREYILNSVKQEFTFELFSRYTSQLIRIPIRLLKFILIIRKIIKYKI
jgi:hypothetical protein